jgi:hypothetical protein
MVEHPFLFSSYALSSATYVMTYKSDSVVALIAQGMSILVTAFLSLVVFFVLCQASIPASDAGSSPRLPLGKLVGIEILFDIGFALCSLFFLFPALWWIVRMCLSLTIGCLEPLSVVESMKRSYALTKGRFWQVSKFLTPAYILVSGLPGLLNNAVHFMIKSAGAVNARDPFSLGGLLLTGVEVTVDIFNTLAACLLTPLLVRVYLLLVNSESPATKMLEER